MSTIHRFAAMCLLLGMTHFASGQDAPKKAELLAALEAALHTDDFAIITANVDQLSVEHLNEIQRFMSDAQVIADARWFDVSAFSSWDEYNFQRPIGDTISGILARRDLFLDAARQLNNRVLTNMSTEALAALAFSQVYVEEKWDHEVPWETEANATFNWIHPDVIATPNLFRLMKGDYLYRARIEYWLATYWSLPMSIAAGFGIGRGTDNSVITAEIDASANAPRLVGYAYPVGNQLYMQTAETVYWYADYLTFGAQRYGPFEPHPLDTRIQFPQNTDLVALPDEIVPGLDQLLNAPFARRLRIELSQTESAAFWNVMRFVHAGARQREGGASAEHPENGQPPLFALQYQTRTPLPVGRDQSDISAFSLLTTIYSDSLLLDFTNWNTNAQTLIVTPTDERRSDGIHRLVSERNKAIMVIEQMGDENLYPNATHVEGSRGLGFSLTTQYDDPVIGDFLPYTGEEAYALVMALTTEARDYGIEASRITLCNSSLLRRGYESAWAGLNGHEWAALTEGFCE